MKIPDLPAEPPCPACGAAIPEDSPGGLCPRCALQDVAAGLDEAEATVPHLRFSTPRLEEVSTAFPQLEILDLVGRGGMGAVYKARQPKLDRLVALKLLPPALAETPGFAERFTREGRALARLSHPNIVSVHEFGEQGGFHYLILEYVEGANLRQAMRAGRFTPAQALDIVPKICEALQFAHDEGVLHRDIKPENILLDARGRVKITDFGIAKFLSSPGESLAALTSDAAPGTPHYMAPEQMESPGEVDHRADIYSLGVVFYELLTGELPLGRFAPPSERCAVDSQVDSIVLRALERERALRQQSAGEVKTQIEGLSAPGAAAPGERRELGPARVSSPDYWRRSWTRWFRLSTGSGSLALVDGELRLDHPWQALRIPLREIREIGIGHLPFPAWPQRRDFLAVTWEGAGEDRETRVFFPDHLAQFPWQWNREVALWADLVRDAAARAAGGAAPAFAPAGALDTQAPGFWTLPLVYLGAFAATLFGGIALGRAWIRSKPWWLDLAGESDPTFPGDHWSLLALCLSVFAAVIVAAGLTQRHHETPGGSLASRRGAAVLLGLVGALILGLLAYALALFFLPP